jgi:paraquat-inducible protein A
MSQSAPVDLIECADCGLLQMLPPASADAVVECLRCARALARPARGSADLVLALLLAALLLLLPAALMPLMMLSCFGLRRQDWLPSGVQALWQDGFGSLAVVVWLFTIAIPFLYLGLMLWVLAGVRLGAASLPGKLFRWAGTLRPWMMLEVYLIGCCVAYSRLQSVGTVSVGVGGWCLLAATLALLLAAVRFDDRSVWATLPTAVVPADSRRLISCASCELLVEAQRERSPCPRCGATLHRRKPYAFGRTLALTIAGFLLYLPANLLPVLSIESYGHQQPNTILGGVSELLSLGLWPLAILVFAASVVVPLMKLFGLSLMLALTQRRSRRWLVGRTRLYRLIDLIGRWSNIDVFMISVLAALVQFGTLTSVRPESGAIAFAAVVIITMIASRCFDARLMWDASGGAA